MELPKALVEVGGRPLLWHVISIFRSQGIERFVLLTGYLGSMIENYVGNEEELAGVQCTVLDTGLDTPTGERVKRASEVTAGERFLVSYVDGLADVDLGGLLEFHGGHGRHVTMTAVRPNLQWGVARLESSGRVEDFVEKPRMDHWVNGGFLCLEPAALEFIEDGEMLEEAPFGRLAAEGELMAFRHEGFWDCVDTYKDLVAVNDLWETGKAPWLRSS